MPDTDIETERQVRRLEEQFKRLSITDSEGDLETGFVIRRELVSVAEIPATGACCTGFEGCADLSAADCAAASGIFRGLGTSCADDPYPCLCPASITLAFAGITVDCGCINDFVAFRSRIVTDLNVNITRIITSAVDCEYTEDNSASVVHEKLYLSNDCPDPPDSESDRVDIISVEFDGTDWRIAYVASGSLALFYARIAGTIIPPVGAITNEINSCSDYPWLSDPSPPGILTSATTVARGGTATIT